jgi:glycosyltransferase involved in cell wall biosynthesis
MRSGPSDPQHDGEIVYSVVLPVYGNEDTLEAAIARLTEVAGRLDGPLEAVFVVDGSPDGSLPLLHRLLPSASIRSQVVVHSRNFGAFPAIRTGLAAARGHYVGVMAADLQEPPELMEDFFRILRSGEYDVAVGQRTSRQDPALSSVASKSFWWLYRRAINPAIPRGGVDVFGCTRQVVEELLALGESHSSLVGLLFWVGFRRAEVPYERAPRPAGTSAWTFGKRVHYLLDSVFSFSELPVRLLTRVGLLGLLISALWGAVVVYAKLTNNIPIPGYSATMLAITFFGALNCFGLGVLGEYVWRAFENTKGRPNYIVSSRSQFPKPEPAAE